MAMAVSKLKDMSRSVSKQIIRKRDSVYYLRTNFKKVLPKSFPHYPQYNIYKGWLLSWNHFIVIICVTTFKCFKMQMAVNLAPSTA